MRRALLFPLFARTPRQLLADHRLARRLACRMLGGYLAGCLSLPAVLAQDTAPEMRSSQIVDVSAGTQVDRRPVISTAALSPDGRELACGGDDHRVRITSAEDGRLLRTLDEHLDWVRAISYRPDGAEMATAGDDRVIHLWSTADGRLLHTIRHAGEAIRSIVYSPDGQRLAVAGFDARITLYQAESGRIAQVLDSAAEDVFALAFSPDATRLAAACGGGRLRIWDLSTGQLSGDLGADTHRLRAVAFSPDGTQLAAGGDGPNLTIWNVATGQPAATLAVRPGKVLSLSYAGPQSLAAGLSNNQIKLFDTVTGQVELRMVGHTGSVATLVWNPAKEALISGSFDTSVRVWSFAERQPATARQPGAAGDVR